MTMDDLDLPDDDALARLLVDSRGLQSAPAALVQRMVALAPAPPQREGVGDALRRLIDAVLSFDSWRPSPGLALEVVRASGSDARQLLFQAGDIDIDVRVRRSSASGSDGWAVSGQVLGPDGAGRTRLRCGGLDAAVAWSDQAEFRFEPVPAGDCVLSLEGDGWAAELPAFTLPGLPAASDA